MFLRRSLEVRIRADALQVKNLRPPSVRQCRARELYWKTQMLSLLEIYMVWWTFRKSVTSEICLMTPHSYTDVMFDFVRWNFQYKKHFDFQYHVRPPSHDPQWIGRRFNFSCASALRVKLGTQDDRMIHILDPTMHLHTISMLLDRIEISVRQRLPKRQIFRVKSRFVIIIFRKIYSF